MQRNEDRQIYAALVEAARQGRRCALATVISARGSTPREVGTKMLIDPDHGLVGTVGGGCGEAEVIEAGRRVLASGKPETVRVDLTEDLYSWSPAVCGGIMNVFVEPVSSDASGAKSAE